MYTHITYIYIYNTHIYIYNTYTYTYIHTNIHTYIPSSNPASSGRAFALTFPKKKKHTYIHTLVEPGVLREGICLDVSKRINPTQRQRHLRYLILYLWGAKKVSKKKVTAHASGITAILSCICGEKKKSQLTWVTGSLAQERRCLKGKKMWERAFKKK
jgi:hypothetical protein